MLIYDDYYYSNMDLETIIDMIKEKCIYMKNKEKGECTHSECMMYCDNPNSCLLDMLTEIEVEEE